MAGDYHNLPELPGEWIAGVNKEVAISVFKDVRGAMIHATPKPSPTSSSWSVSVIGSDRWDESQSISRDVDFEQVGKTIVRVANALDTGDEIETLGPIPPADNTESEAPPDDVLYEVVNCGGVVTETGFESKQGAETAANEYDEIIPESAPHTVQRMDDEDWNQDEDKQFGLSSFG